VHALYAVCACAHTRCVHALLRGMAALGYSRPGVGLTRPLYVQGGPGCLGTHLSGIAGQICMCAARGRYVHVQQAMCSRPKRLPDMLTRIE
jgi:hypothetical protein